MTRLLNITRHVDDKLRHLYDIEFKSTLCGLSSGIGWTNLLHKEVPYLRLCGNCARTHARYMTDRVEPEIEPDATRRGAVLADAGRVREVSGQIFRVAGSTDTYTVIIPSETDLASTCTCMAAKTHPEVMCKHVSAVYLTIGASNEG